MRFVSLPLLFVIIAFAAGASSGCFVHVKPHGLHGDSHHSKKAQHSKEKKPKHAPHSDRGR